MKTIKQVGFTLLMFSLFAACQDELKDCPPVARTEETINLLTLGDSRVEGERGSHESYRYELWKLLVTNNWDVDFIGSRSDEGDYERFQTLCFDRDHEGTGGAMTTDILRTLSTTNFEYTPEVVLLGIGGNDLLDGGQAAEPIISNISQIIDDLRALNSSVIILLEQIAPGHSSIMTEELTKNFLQFNEAIGELALSKADSLSPLIAIDMARDWNDSYMPDEVHYNEAGAKLIAERYYQAFEQIVKR